MHIKRNYGHSHELPILKHSTLLTCLRIIAFISFHWNENENHTLFPITFPTLLTATQGFP